MDGVGRAFLKSGRRASPDKTADDLRIPDGRVRDSGFDEFQEHAARIAGRILNDVFEAYGGVSRTRNAGTPALPMDDWSGRVGLTIPRDADTFRAGLDWHWSRFDALLKNAVTGAEQNNTNNATRTGGAALWPCR